MSMCFPRFLMVCITIVTTYKCETCWLNLYLIAVYTKLSTVAIHIWFKTSKCYMPYCYKLQSWRSFKECSHSSEHEFYSCRFAKMYTRHAEHNRGDRGAINWYHFFFILRLVQLYSSLTSSNPGFFYNYVKFKIGCK